MLRFLGGILFCFLTCSSAEARFPRGSGPTSTAPAGFNQINPSDGDIVGGLLNVFDTATTIFFDNGATPAQIDSKSLPRAPLTSSQQFSFGLQFSDDQTGPTTDWVFKWTPVGTGTLPLFLNASNGSVSASGCSVVGTGTTLINMTGGTPCRVVFRFTALPGGALLTQFRAGTWGVQTTKPVLARLSDEPAIDAGGTFTPELIALYRGLNLKTIRPMPWINSLGGNANNLARWELRTPSTSIAWRGARWFPEIYGGDTTGTNFYTVAPGSGTSLADWTDGETIQANVTNQSTVYYTGTNATNNGSGLIRVTVASTTGLSTGQKVYLSNFNGTTEANGVWTITVINGTTFDLQGSAFVNTYTGGASYVSVQTLTVTGKTNGTKNVSQEGLTAFNAGQPLTTGGGTFVYNATMDVLMWKAGGITDSVPVEKMIELANLLNANFWFTVPMYANSSFVPALTALVAGSLNSALSFYIEYSNETWNSGFPQFAYTFIQGNWLNISGQPGFTGLRAAQVFTQAQTAWAAAGRTRNTLRNALMWQAFSGTSSTQSYTMNGQDLNPTSNQRLCAYLGGTFSGTCSGAPNYSTSGNRPVDLADVGGYATYYSGELYRNFGYGDPAVRTTYVVSSLQAMATAFNSNPNDPTSLAMIDEDFRQGIYNQIAISSVSTTTINAAGNGLANNDRGRFITSGALPSPLVPNKIYFVVSAATNAFSVALTRGGAAISLSGGSGTHAFGRMSSDTNNLGNESLLTLSTIVMQSTVSAGFGGWQQVVAGYDGARAGFGKSPLRIELYEGALEGKAPTAAECTTMGITVGGSAATAATALAAGLAAYKNDVTYGRNIALAMLNQFMGTDASAPTFGLMTHSKTPSWFVVGAPASGCQWCLLPGPVGSTPYQTYNGVASFVGQLN